MVQNQFHEPSKPFKVMAELKFFTTKSSQFFRTMASSIGPRAHILPNKMVGLKENTATLLKRVWR
jgi:hypothetical protein